MPNPFPLLAIAAPLLARRLLWGAVAAGGVYLVGRTAYEAGRTVGTVSGAVQNVIPLATYALGGIAVYNIARKGRPF